MSNEVNSWVLSRRHVLTLAGACLVPANCLYAKEFWDKKDPSQWTGEEIDQLTSKSPWAKPATATYAPGENGGYGQQRGGGGYPGGGMGGPRVGIGGIGVGMPRGRNGGGRGRGGAGGMSNYKGTVRWESAQPIRDAVKSTLPEAFANHFVIGVRDIPLIVQNRTRPQDTDYPDSTTTKPDTSDQATKEAIDNLKTITTLQPKGRDLAQASVVQQITPGGTYFLFGFSKDGLDFGKKDHEVDFYTRLGRLIVKCKFDPSYMLYHNQLAV